MQFLQSGAPGKGFARSAVSPAFRARILPYAKLRNALRRPGRSPPGPAPPPPRTISNRRPIRRFGGALVKSSALGANFPTRTVRGYQRALESALAPVAPSPFHSNPSYPAGRKNLKYGLRQVVLCRASSKTSHLLLAQRKVQKTETDLLVCPFRGKSRFDVHPTHQRSCGSDPRIRV